MSARQAAHQMLHALMLLIAACASGLGCGTDAPQLKPGLNFGPPGPIATMTGRGSFAFGVATAATQIEDQNPHTDWWLWTAPKPAGLANGEHVGNAVRGFTHAIDDVSLITSLGLDVYRFSVEWARVEPARDAVDEAALSHYSNLLDALVSANVRPMITVHHFSNPVWVDDPRDPGCSAGPTDSNLCGWDHPEGGPATIDELAEHAATLARRFGDRVDDWATINEPINYFVASYGAGVFPPGKRLLLSAPDAFVQVIRNVAIAHTAVYQAIKANDTVDADGDGHAAHVGMTLSIARWAPARDNLPSDNPEDVEATNRVAYVYHFLIPEALQRGAFDPALDQSFSEPHPEWAGTLDWLGLQYYFRAGVTGQVKILPLVDATICFSGLDQGACLAPDDPTHFVPSMDYEFWAPGLYDLLGEFSRRFPDLPLTVTESGIATESGRRRAEHIVRSLQQIHRAIEDGMDIRGYYHWSLMDNFEWAEGYEPRFWPISRRPADLRTPAHRGCDRLRRHRRTTAHHA